MENIKTPRRDFMTEMGMDESIVFENPDYDSAIIGYDAVEHRIVYDFNKMVEHLMDVDGMEYDEAVEFIEYNTIRATPYAGPNAPIIIYNMDEDMSYMNYCLKPCSILAKQSKVVDCWFVMVCAEDFFV
jgi:hypothetical protein